MAIWSLLWTLAQYLGLLIFGIVFLYAARDLLCYLNLEHFRKQGVKCVYVPVIGFLKFFITKPGQNDDLINLKKFLDDNKEEPLIMFNTYRRKMPVGLLLDDGLIREFLVKEMEYTHKIAFVKNVNFGFFFQNGEKLLDARATYSDFFSLDNLEKMTTVLGKKVKNIMLDFGKHHIPEGKEYVKLDIHHMAETVFSEIVNSILFAQDEPQQFGGKPLAKAIQSYLVRMFEINKRVENILSLDFLHEYKLHPKTRSGMKYGQDLEDLCWSLYQKRLQEGPKSDPNLLDMLVQKNKENEAAGKPILDKYDIAGHFNLLQFAGADTSLETSSTFIYYMANNPDFARDFTALTDQMWSKRNLDEYLTWEDLNSNERFEEYMAETLRLFAPFPILSPREFIKPCQIGKYQFRAGDRIHVPSRLIHINQKYFEDPMEFKPERMNKSNKSNIKRGTYNPFGNGRRICVGKSLGEIMVKLVTLMFFRLFEVVKDDEYIPKQVFVLGYNYANPSVLIRWRGGVSPAK